LAVPAQILSAAQLTAMKNKLERQSRKPIESKPSTHQWALCVYNSWWQGYPVNEYRFNRVKNFYSDPTTGPQGWYHTQDSGPVSSALAPSTMQIFRKCPVYRNDLRRIDVFADLKK